jgi:class I fructose-bisphosphate aldolase
MNIQDIEKLLGAEGQALLSHECKTISKDHLHLPGPDFVDRVVGRIRTARRRYCATCNCTHSTQGGWPDTGFVSILPVDQGIEHSAGASFAKNPIYFDPPKSSKLAIEGGCNAVTSTLGVLGSCAANTRTRFPSSSKSTTTNF